MNIIGQIIGKIIFVIVGIGMIVFGIFITTDSKKAKKNCTVEVTGTVISVDESIETDSDGYTDTYYTAKIQYEYNGETYTTYGEQRTEVINIGSTCTFKINPDNPNEVMFGEGTPAFIGIIVIGMGVLFAFGGIFGRSRAVRVR